MNHCFGIHHGARTERHIAANRAGGGANGPIQKRSAESMEKAPIETGTLKFAHRPGVAVRQNRLRTILGCSDRCKAFRDGLDRLGPGDTGELAFTFGADALHGIKEPAFVVDAIEIARDFLTQEAASKRMFGIAAQGYSPAILYLHDHAASIGAIVRTNSPNGREFLLH